MCRLSYKEMLSDPNIVNSPLSLGYVPKTFKLAMIKPLVNLIMSN